MIFEYWTISYRPAPMSLTRYGIGLVVRDPVSLKLDYQILPRNSKIAPKTVTSSLPVQQLEDFLKLTKSLSTKEHPTFEYDRAFDARSLLNHAVKNWNNHLEAIGPHSVESESVEAALSLLSETHLRLSERQTEPRKKRVVRDALLQEYENSQLIKPLISRDPDLLLPKKLDRKLDLAIVNDQILEIDFTFNFAGEPNNNVQNAADSWALRLNEIRSGNACLSLAPGQDLSVPKNVPIVAAVHPAVSSDQKRLFRRSTETWREMDVKIVALNAIPEHAHQLEKRIAG